jgi:hypothetical protein
MTFNHDGIMGGFSHRIFQDAVNAVNPTKKGQMPTPKIPWQKIKELVLAQAGQVWDDEEKEMRRIVDAAKEEDKILGVSFAVTIDCSTDPITAETKISFSEKFSTKVSGSIDEAQMNLGEQPEKPQKETAK